MRDNIPSASNMLRTYDITDDDMEIIKAALRERDRPDIAKQLQPVCDVDERLVYTAQAFREHFDGGGDESEQYVLDHATDEQILNNLGDESIYNAWAETCGIAMHELQVEFANEIAKERNK